MKCSSPQPIAAREAGGQSKLGGPGISPYNESLEMVHDVHVFLYQFD